MQCNAMKLRHCKSTVKLSSTLSPFLISQQHKLLAQLSSYSMLTSTRGGIVKLFVE